MPLSFLLSLWPAIPALALAWLLHGWDVGRIEANQAKALTEQATALQEQCQADKKITEETSHAYQERIASINAKLAERMRQPAACIPVSPAKHTGGTHAAGKQPDVPRAVGLSDGWLYGFAGHADKDRAKQIGLAEFIRKVWSANGQ